MNGPNRWGPVESVRGILLGSYCLVLLGCSADAIRVTDSEISDESTHAWLFGSTSEPKTTFTTQDEKVTMTVRFGLNYVATYLVYEIEWIAPGNRLFLREPMRTQWGTHRVLIATLPIRGQPAARLTGEWVVRLHLKDRQLIERRFELVRAEADEYPDPLQNETCPPANRPPGDCVDRLPQE